MSQPQQPTKDHGINLLTLYKDLLNNGKKHYIANLMNIAGYRRKNIYTLMHKLEDALRADLETGTDNDGRRWFRVKSYNYRKTEPITAKKLTTLHLCYNVSQGLLPSDTIDTAKNTILRLSRLLKDSEYSSRDVIQHQKILSCPKGCIQDDKNRKHLSHVKALADAIRERKYCKIQYTRTNATTSKEYSYAPTKIVCSNNTYYPLGHKMSHATNEIRPTCFALHRIGNVNKTTQSFSHEFNETIFSHVGLSWHEPKEFSIHFSAKVVLHHAPHVELKTADPS